MKTRTCQRCDGRAKKRHRYCDRCYRIGALALERNPVIKVPRRPELVDTGLRIDDLNQELIHLDGRREWPVPDAISFPNHFFDSDGRGTIRVLTRRA